MSTHESQLFQLHEFAFRQRCSEVVLDERRHLRIVAALAPSAIGAADAHGPIAHADQPEWNAG